MKKIFKLIKYIIIYYSIKIKEKGCIIIIKRINELIDLRLEYNTYVFLRKAEDYMYLASNDFQRELDELKILIKELINK